MAQLGRKAAASAASCCLAAGVVVLGLGFPAWGATPGVPNSNANSNAGGASNSNAGNAGVPNSNANSNAGGGANSNAGNAGVPNSNANSNAGGGANSNAGGNGGNPNGNGAGSGTPPGNAPPGNNGTIKIDEYTMDPGQDNDPHVTCGFSVSFYGYDGGPQSATIKVTAWAPTAGGTPTTFGPVTWNIGTRTSGNQFDANYQVSQNQLAPVLSGVTPTAQGYHLRVEVEVTGSKGADDKFKMLWLEPCVGAPGPAPGTPGSPGPAPGVPGGTSGVTSPATASSSSSTPSPVSTTVAVLPPVLTTSSLPLVDTAPALAVRTAGLAGTAPARGFLAGALAFTGLVLLPILVGGLALSAAGVLLMRWSRRHRRLA